MRDKLYFMLLVLHFMQTDYGLGFFCSIEKAESPCRTLVTLVDRTMGEARKESLRSIILYVTVFYMSYAVFS